MLHYFMPYGQKVSGNFPLICLLLRRDLKLGVATLKTGRATRAVGWQVPRCARDDDLNAINKRAARQSCNSLLAIFLHAAPPYLFPGFNVIPSEARDPFAFPGVVIPGSEATRDPFMFHEFSLSKTPAISQQRGFALLTGFILILGPC